MDTVPRNIYSSVFFRYGIEPIGQVVYNEDGLIDSFNFETPAGFTTYANLILLHSIMTA